MYMDEGDANDIVIDSIVIENKDDINEVISL